METKSIGILHPGAMGISIAASAKDGGHSVYWVSEGRSEETRNRAEEHNLLEAETLRELCERCEVLISVCPPHAAEDVAREALGAGFRGLYVDANAIAPQRARRIANLLGEAGVGFVDGGIVGGPAWKPNNTWLHLSGERTAEAAALFKDGPLETNILSKEIGEASALKMCFAAYTKGSTALITAVLGAAEALSVRQALAEQWEWSEMDLAKSAAPRARRVTAKAWRFAGEMEEIAATFENAGMPGGFHQAAGEIYQRLAPYKGAAQMPELDEVLASLMDEPEDV